MSQIVVLTGLQSLGPPAPTPSFGTAYSSPLIFLLLSSGGAWSLSPSAAKACPRRATGQDPLPRGRLRLFKSDGEQMMMWWLRERTDANAICDPGAKQ